MMICRHRNCENSAVMLFWSLSLLLCIGGLSKVIGEPASSNNRSELKHVHVIFSHKFYAPLEAGVKYGFPEKLDYRYFLENTADMSNSDKMEIYNLGVYLRRRYDEFLGGIYYPEVMVMRTSEYFLSMISGLLVNAGLWPPVESQKWKDDLAWQPIPTEYEQMDKDTLFLGSFCPHFQAEEKLILDDETVKAQISIHEPFFSYVTKNYGKKIDHPSEIAMLYSCLETIASDPDGTLPSWTDGIFPHGEMLNVTLLSHDLLSKTSTQKRLNGGIFLKKIIGDSKKLSSTKLGSVGSNDGRPLKISAFSGEERNVVGVLRALNLWSTPHVPENGAAIMFELRRDRTSDVFGLEIFYYTGVEDNETIALRLSGCEAFCPLNDFARILVDVLPDDENVLCHATTTAKDGEIGSSGDSRYQRPLRFNRFFIAVVALISIKF